jgi:hypothetical protein
VEAITLNVISEDADGVFTEALTDNYLKTRLRGRHAPNRWVSAKVDRIDNEVLQATLIEAAVA